MSAFQTVFSDKFQPAAAMQIERPFSKILGFWFMELF